MNSRVLMVGVVSLLIIGGYVVFSNTGSSIPAPNSPTPLPTHLSQYYYPMTHYPDRITNRGYGKTITARDSQGLPCGAPFTGLHVGDDLEVTADELTTDVPVYSIADGTVRQVRAVNGYGGLIVVQHDLKGQVITAYYGHINLARTTVKAGDQVKAGQQLTVLGEACSPQTSHERKHLHFAMHSGTAIDVKGYAPTSAALTAWINPKTTLTSLQAQKP